MEKKEFIGRIQVLKDAMKREGIDYYVIPTADYHGSEYVSDFFKFREFLCGFTGSNGTLVVGPKETGLWTDGRYFIQAQNELEGTGVVLFRMMEEGVPTILEYLEKNINSGDTIGFDGRVIPVTFGRNIAKKANKSGVRIIYDRDLSTKVFIQRPELPHNKLNILDVKYAGKTVADKLKIVRKSMKEAEADTFVLTKLDDIMWLTNLRGSDVDYNPVALSYAVIYEQEFVLFLREQAVTSEIADYLRDNNIVLKDYNEFYDYTKSISKRIVLLDDCNTNYCVYATLEEDNEIIIRENPTELPKAVKNETECQNMRDVYVRDSVAVTKFIYWLKKNIGKERIDEISAADYLEELRRENKDMPGLSFPTISAWGANAAMMHYEATADSYSEVKPEGFLLVDSGGQYLGGTTDVTRTIVCGPLSEKMKEHFTLVACGMLSLTNAVFLYGCTGRNLDILAREPLWRKNIDYKCGTGHGVGFFLNVHEGPQGIRWMYNKNLKEAILEEGMAVTNEPGVYIANEYGIRTENVMLVRKDEKNSDGQFMRFETLTYVPIDPDAMDKKYMEPSDIIRYNQYQKSVYETIAPFLNQEEATWLKQETRPL